MSTTDVSGLVTPVYTATLPITTDGSVLTQADLTNTIVSLANRVEFIRQIGDAATEPELITVLREDFFSAIWDGSSRLDGSFAWRTAHSGSPAITHDGGTARRPGRLICQMPPNSQFSFGIAGVADTPFGFLSTDMITFVAKVDDDPANIASSATFGMLGTYTAQNGGANALALFYQKTFPNWRVMIQKASVQTLVDTGVPVVPGEFVTVRFIWRSPGPDIDVELDGSIVHTVLSANRPTGEANIGANVISSVAETEVFLVEFDFIYARGRGGSPSRSGPG